MASGIPQQTTELDIPAIATHGGHSDTKEATQNMMGIGQNATQPDAITGQPIISSQQAWPSLPATLGTTSPIVSSISTNPARAATEAVDPLVQKEALPVLITKQEEGVNYEVVQVANDIPITTTEMETSAPARNTGEPFTTTDVAVAQTTVLHDEYGDDTTPNKDDA